MLLVCGITYSHSPNYGSCLQAYALKVAIEELEICGEHCKYSLIPIQILRDYPVNGIANQVFQLFLRWYRKPFQAFYRQYLDYADITSMTQLNSLNNSFDAFVCGSDVIWNQDFNRGLGAYYLDFADKYRFSYAASFGKAEVSEEQIKTISKYINRLNSISLREASGIEIIKKCTDHQVEVVADPVLLLSKKHWETIAQNKEKKDKYLFVYATHLNDIILQYLNSIQKKTGMKIIWAVAGPKQAIKRKMIQIQSPQLWLRQLIDAEYVVTNSFHATAFSVMFHKKFFTVVNGDKAKGINVRMNDFLNSLGLGDRIFSSVPEDIDLGEIDYSGVDDKIAALREKSLSFLRENLEAAYRQKMEFEAKQQ